MTQHGTSSQVFDLRSLSAAPGDLFAAALACEPPTLEGAPRPGWGRRTRGRRGRAAGAKVELGHVGESGATTSRRVDRFGMVRRIEIEKRGEGSSFGRRDPGPREVAPSPLWDRWSRILVPPRTMDEEFRASAAFGRLWLWLDRLRFDE